MARKKQITVEEFLPHYLRHLRAKAKPRTIAEYERLLRTVVLPEWGAKQMTTITVRHIDQWHLRIRERTPVQANRAMAVLSGVLKLAARWGHIPVSPVYGVSWAPEKPRNRYLTRDELARLKAALDHVTVEEGAFIRTALYTGARPGELLAARWEDRTTPSTLELPDGKTGGRTVYLPETAQAALATLPEVPVGLIFPAVNASALWRRVRRRAKLDGVRLYDLRHSFASAGIQAGLTLEAISQLLGHRQPDTTRKYAHLMRETGTESAAKIGDVLNAMGG